MRDASVRLLGPAGLAVSTVSVLTVQVADALEPSAFLPSAFEMRGGELIFASNA